MGIGTGYVFSPGAVLVLSIDTNVEYRLRKANTASIIAFFSCDPSFVGRVLDSDDRVRLSGLRQPALQGRHHLLILICLPRWREWPRP